MVFLYITDEDQIRFEPRHVHYVYIFYVLPKICVIISHVKPKNVHLKYPYIQFICRMASEIFAGGGQFFILPRAHFSLCAGLLNHDATSRVYILSLKCCCLWLGQPAKKNSLVFHAVGLVQNTRNHALLMYIKQGYNTCIVEILLRQVHVHTLLFKYFSKYSTVNVQVRILIYINSQIRHRESNSFGGKIPHRKCDFFEKLRFHFQDSSNYQTFDCIKLCKIKTK